LFAKGELSGQVLAPFLFVASACSASVRFATASVRWIDGGVCLQRVQNALDWRQGGGNGTEERPDSWPDAGCSCVFLDHHHFSTWAVAGPSLDRALKCAYVTMNSLLDCFDAKELNFPREKITGFLFIHLPVVVLSLNQSSFLRLRFCWDSCYLQWFSFLLGCVSAVARRAASPDAALSSCCLSASSRAASSSVLLVTNDHGTMPLDMFPYKIELYTHTTFFLE
jgi:hypothetical protein